MNTAIQTEKLTLEISGRVILDEIDFSMNRGEYVSVIGPNGAGKTSLIKCICGIHSHWNGDIHIGTQNARHLSARKRAKSVSYVPQAEGRSFPFTVEEFVMLGRYPHLSPFTTFSPEDKTAVHNALEQTGTAPFRSRSMDTLSGGERQMVFIAAALAQGANILVLDEPATFLDYRHKAEVFRLLRKLNRDQAISILTVSHNLNTAARCSSRILAIKDGKNCFFGKPDALLNTETLHDIFQTQFRFIREEGHNLPFVLTEDES